MYYISVALILMELFHLEYLNLQSIILRSSDWISINRPPFDSSYREESNGIYYISIALILTELFRFEFYNKNLTLFTPISTLFRTYFDPRGVQDPTISTLGFNFGFMYNPDQISRKSGLDLTRSKSEKIISQSSDLISTIFFLL